MPNRVIKESICTSENVDMLTPFQETVFYRLIVNCDDFGRMDARPKILASKLFPLKDVRPNQIDDALQALTSAELVSLYEVDGKPFVQMNTWDRHQTIRAKKSKYPPMKASENICKQMQADECKCYRNPIQSESNPNPNPKLNPNPSAETTAADNIPLDTYLHQNLLSMSPGNFEALRSLMEDGITPDVVKYAVDRATGIGKRTWAYVQGILNAWVIAGVKNVADAKAESEKHSARMRAAKHNAPTNQALNYEQRDGGEAYTDEYLDVAMREMMDMYGGGPDNKT